MDYAIEILRQELYKIGGEIYAKGLSKEILNRKAENGDEEAKSELSMLEFTDRLLKGSIKDGKSDKFKELVAAINYLDTFKEADE